MEEKPRLFARHRRLILSAIFAALAAWTVACSILVSWADRLLAQ